MSNGMLNGFEPGQEDIYRAAINQPLQTKIEKAIELLKLFEPPDGYFLAYSGGKDSGVILELAIEAGVKFECHYKVTTLDPPELVQFIKKQHPEVVFDHPPKALLTRMVEKSCGPPTRLARWCCAEFKEAGGTDLFKILGVRAPESPRRKATWKQFIANRRGGHILCPILFWTEKDVWDFHTLQRIPYCSLYDEGFRRLGCIGCPLAGAKAQAREFARWPRYERLWHRAFFRFWDRWHDVPTNKGARRWFEDFQNPENLFQWWKSGKNSKDFMLTEAESDCQMSGLYD